MSTDKNNLTNEEQPGKKTRGADDEEQFREKLNHEFPLSGAETDEDLSRALGLDDEDTEDEEDDAD